MRGLFQPRQAQTTPPTDSTRDKSVEANPTGSGVFSKGSKNQKNAYAHAENDEACAGLWTVYISEAERYDKALVESWKEDMTGLLIFVSYPLCAEVVAHLSHSRLCTPPASLRSSSKATKLFDQILQTPQMSCYTRSHNSYYHHR
jgi:hypothetical protein